MIKRYLDWCFDHPYLSKVISLLVGVLMGAIIGLAFAYSLVK